MRTKPDRASSPAVPLGDLPLGIVLWRWRPPPALVILLGGISATLVGLAVG